MGCSSNSAQKALIKNGNNLDAAIEWIFSNLDDPSNFNI